MREKSWYTTGLDVVTVGIDTQLPLCHYILRRTLFTQRDLPPSPIFHLTQGTKTPKPALRSRSPLHPFPQVFIPVSSEPSKPSRLTQKQPAPITPPSLDSASHDSGREICSRSSDGRARDESNERAQRLLLFFVARRSFGGLDFRRRDRGIGGGVGCFAG